MTDLPPAVGFEPDPLANLDLSSALPVAKQRICTVEILGIVEPADIAAVLTKQPPAERTDPPTSAEGIQRIREKHHSVARLIASGLTQRMVAEFSGYTEAYLSTLLNAPAMVELVAFYRGNYTSASEIMAERLRTLSGAALEKLMVQLEGEEALDPHVLIAAIKLGADRSGNGPTSYQHNKTESHIFDHAALQQRHQQVRQSNASRIVQAPAALPSPAVEEGLGDVGS